MVSSAESALIGRVLRVQGRSIATGDVVLYRGDGHNDDRVGKIDFIVSLGGNTFTCLSNWPVQHKTGQWRKAVVKNEFAIVPAACMLTPVIFTPTKVGNVATVLMPALY